jgi:flagellar motor switch protein FliN
MENTATNNIERLFDVEMNVTVRFGQTEIPLRDVVKFGIGTMVELDRTIDDPVELLVNNFPFAKGEVVVIDGYYGVRVTEIGSPEERSQTLFSAPKKDEPKPAAKAAEIPAETQAIRTPEQTVATKIEKTDEV